MDQTSTLCTACGGAVPQDGRFCPKCGKEIAAASVPPPPPPQVQQPMYQPPPPPPQAQPAVSPLSSSRGLIIVVAAVALIGILGYMGYLTPGPKSGRKGDEQIEGTYRCRNGAQFHIDPEDAMVEIEGKVIGRADDWDGFGGGSTYYFEKPGKYEVKLSLPGYKTKWIQITVAPEAEDEIERIFTKLRPGA